MRGNYLMRTYENYRTLQSTMLRLLSIVNSNIMSKVVISINVLK